MLPYPRNNRKKYLSYMASKTLQQIKDEIVYLFVESAPETYYVA